ncbi:MAG: cbb3-type cytochrome c oxidase subunit I [Dehalococcoidia bacterium]|nr:cbb3-type cytochrome c oxidase subunit I [Dehalococcoidia bacterium]
MSRTTLGFIFAGLVYLVIGVTLGALFYIVPGTMRLRGVHAHLNLVGFVTFLIFGIGYHILPRFRGRPLHSEKLAWFQFWVANVGLLGLSLVNTLVAYEVLKGVSYLQVVFGVLLVLSMYLFIHNMFRTLVTAPTPAKK